jgi:DNA-binding transcriptional MocR family regulator
MLGVTIDGSSEIPAYRQICRQVMALVDEGILPPGHRMPPSRALGPDLGVHRSTIVRVYAELRALGYVESRSGSYTTVRGRERIPTARAAASTGAIPAPTAIDWDQAVRPGVHDLPALSHLEPRLAGHGSEVIDMGSLSADPSLAPDRELRRCMREVLSSSGGAALDYGDPGGSGHLREILARRMARHGVAAAADEVVVTAGAQHALDLLLRYLTTPDDVVVVEAPTYRLMHPLLELHRLRALEIPMLDDGMDLDGLERGLSAGGRENNPRLVYTMPSFHNPTGVTTGQEHRERLLMLCERYGVPVVEDGYVEEMKYTGQEVLPVKSMDSGGIVLYVGTLSKIMSPGLRVGWITAPRRAAAHLAGLLYASSLSGNTLAQATVAAFCSRGAFEAYLRRIHRVYRRRMGALLDSLEAHMPPRVRWTRPRGGYTVWLTLPEGAAPEDIVAARAAANGVIVSPGRAFFGRRPARSHLRLSIACVDEAVIDEGCRRLGAELSG